MYITSGLIYYFVIFALILNLLLALLLIKPLRKVMRRLITKYNISLDNQFLYSLLYFVFTALLAVLLDSIWNFSYLYNDLDFGMLYSI